MQFGNIFDINNTNSIMSHHYMLLCIDKFAMCKPHDSVFDAYQWSEFICIVLVLIAVIVLTLVLESPFKQSKSRLFLVNNFYKLQRFCKKRIKLLKYFFYVLGKSLFVDKTEMDMRL